MAKKIPKITKINYFHSPHPPPPPAHPFSEKTVAQKQKPLLPTYITSLPFPFTCSQIWLSPLLDDRQPTYLTSLEKKATLPRVFIIIIFNIAKVVIIHKKI
jgi:hypothetical protein